MNKRKSRTIVCLWLIVFMFIFSSYPSLSSLFVFDFNNDANLRPSATNTLFNGKPYPFELNDFYDDEDLDHIWTGANFSTEAFNDTTFEWSGTINNDTVTPVNNTETQYGDPSNINMINGTTDSLDNMKSNDASYTTFTSTHTDGYIREMPSQWDNFTFTKGSGDTIGELETIDANWSVIGSETGGIVYGDPEYISSITYDEGAHYSGNIAQTQGDDGYSYTGKSLTTYLKMNIFFSPSVNGRKFRISAHITGSTMSGGTPDVKINLIINGVEWYGSEHVIDFDNQEYPDPINTVEIDSDYQSGTKYINIYYLKFEEIMIEELLDVQVDAKVSDIDLSSIEFFKYSHKTSVSVDVDLDIWNWGTSTWYEIESVDNSASFDDDSFTLGSGSAYVNETNCVRMRFQAMSLSGAFELHIDRLRLDYLTTPIAELETTITLSFARYNEDLLAMNVQSWQRTNTSQTIEFKIWNYDTESYVQISSSSDIAFTKKEYNTESPSNFISPSGVVKLCWNGSDTINDFELHIDYLLVKIYYKLDLLHTKSFDTNGIYRYRWVVFGSIHYTQWVVFEVVDPEPNFYAISESEQTTRWILQNASLSSVEDFHDDINTDYWNLGDVSEKEIWLVYQDFDDSYTYSVYPDNNFGNVNNIQIKNVETYSYLKRELPSYLVSNYTRSSLLYGYRLVWNTGFVSTYTTNDFDEGTITWNNQPPNITYQIDTTIPSGHGWNYINLGSPYNYYVLRSNSSNHVDIGVYSTESANKPTMYHYISKNYFGDGYTYMQTNTTELISLKSKDYGAHKTLNSGDYFEVDFQTNSDSKIELILLKDGVVNKTLTLSKSGNTNFGRHTAKISVDEFVEFDQLKISSTFEDTDNVKIYDIKTYKYELVGDYADFIVGSKRDYEIYLTPDTYNLRIFDPYDGDIVINENITIPATGVKQYLYAAIETVECRLTLFNIGKEKHLDFVDYHITINRSLNGIYNDFELLEPIFYADINTYIYINVSDRFGTLIDTFEKIVTDYIDLELEVYQLQIKNLMTQKTVLNINSSLFVHPLLSGDSIYFTLSKAYYTIQYYDTNDVEKQFTIYLDSNQAYELNRSQICFLSYTDEQGNHLFFEDYKTYLNGSLIYEKVFYEEIGTTVHINVTDRYGINLYSEIYTVLASDNYIPIILEVYELKLMNMQNEFNNIVIERSPFPIVGTVGDIIESGHFPASYSFDDEVGLSDTDISYIDLVNSLDSCEIVEEYDGHKGVLRYSDATTGSFTHYPNFPVEGVYEFWFDCLSGASRFYIFDSASRTILLLRFYDTNVRVYYGDGDGGTDYTAVNYGVGLNHFKYDYDFSVDTFDFYCNNVLELDDVPFLNDYDASNITRIMHDVYVAGVLYYDAIGFSWDNYNIGDNLHDSYYLGYEPFEAYNMTNDAETELEANGWIVDKGDAFNNVSISGEYNSHKKFLNLTDDSTVENIDVIFAFSDGQATGTIEFWVKNSDATKQTSMRFQSQGGANAFQLVIGADKFQYYDGAWDDVGLACLDDTWYHIKLIFDCTPDTYEIWIDGVQYQAVAAFVAGAHTTINTFRAYTGIGDTGYSTYFDTLAFSWISGYYVGDNYNFYDVESEYSWTTNIAPNEVVSFRLLKGFYNIWMTNSEGTISYSFRMFDDNYFVLNSSQMCFLSYTNQRGEYLEFNQFKTYWNDTLLYENVFYEWIGKNASIEIKDHYDISVKNHSFIVSSGDNYIPVILTMYSLKVMNQQEVFNHINITRDPNYYPDNPYYWSEWIAPTEIIEFKLFAGYYKINLTNNENGGSSSYDYTLNGDDVILITSGNLLSQVIYNIANVNTTIGNQITNVQIDLTNQNSNINNTIINIDINLSNVNSSIGNLLTNINLDIININNNISNLYTFTENNFLNLGNNINNSFISIENNIIAINQTISTLVIGLDGKVTIVNATINTMFTEMNSQFVVVQSTLDFSFAFLNQTIIQIGNNITTNQIALNNLIVQRANDIDNNLIQITNLINLLNSTVANESLVVQTLVNIIGSNITENHVIINNLINLLGNNITENNLNLVNLIEVVGNNITTNQFVIQTLIDYVSNNITDNHLELLTNINFINNTMDQNQIELINRLLFINNSINQMALDLTNQIIFVNDTIYSAILSVSTSIDFNSDCILGNISLTYQQNDFLTELYKKTMFSQLLNWSDVAYNYSLMEDRIDVWEFINNYRNESVQVLLRYNDLIDNLTISAQNTIEQYLPNENVEYRLWSVANEEYLTDWVELPENRTVSFGFYEEEIPDVPDFNAPGIWLMIILILMGCGFAIALVGYLAYRYRKKSENYRRSYADKVTLEAQTIKKFSQGTRIR